MNDDWAKPTMPPFFSQAFCASRRLRRLAPFDSNAWRKVPRNSEGYFHSLFQFDLFIHSIFLKKTVQIQRRLMIKRKLMRSMKFSRMYLFSFPHHLPLPLHSSHSTPSPLSSANSSQDSLHRGQVRPPHPATTAVSTAAAGGVHPHHPHPHHPYAVAGPAGNMPYGQMHGAYGSAASGLHHHHHHQFMHSNTGQSKLFAL